MKTCSCGVKIDFVQTAAGKKIPFFAISAIKEEGLRPLVEALARGLARLGEGSGEGSPE